MAHRNRGSTRIPLRERVSAAGGWYAWANSRLIRLAGPATLGPYETEPEPDRRRRPCPLCGAPMDEHSIDRSGPRTFVDCPR